MFLTNPSATEIHPTLSNEEAIQIQTFKLGKDSILEYIPEPIIPFKKTNFHGKTVIHLSDGAQVLMSDIITAGRIGFGEVYEYSCLKSIFEVYKNDKLIVCDRLLLSPDQGLTTKGILGDFTHMGTLWILSENITEEHLHHIQSNILAQENCYGGASLLQENGLVIRLLGYTAESLQIVIQTCWDYFRKELLGLNPLGVLK